MAKLTEKVYGDALFELAVDEKRTEELLTEVKTIQDVISANPDFAKLMQHPGIPESEKEEILKTVWEGKISREVEGLMLLLLKKEHYSELPKVLDYFVEKVKEKEGIGTAYVTTPMPLTDVQKKAVEKRLIETTKYCQFEIHFAVDETLIGGMVVRIGDRVLDNSIKNRLDHLSRQLYQVKLQ